MSDIPVCNCMDTTTPTPTTSTTTPTTTLPTTLTTTTKKPDYPSNILSLFFNIDKKKCIDKIYQYTI
jgi:hypothetical protein